MKGFERLLGWSLAKKAEDGNLAYLVHVYPTTYPRYLLLETIKEITPDPSKDATGAQYNALAGRVNSIISTLFITGYDVMQVKKTTAIRRARMAASNDFVPIEEYSEVEERVNAIENLLTIPSGAIMGTVKTSEGDIPPALPFTSDEYVTQEQFSLLEDYVVDLESLLSSSTYTLFVAKR